MRVFHYSNEDCVEQNCALNVNRPYSLSSGSSGNAVELDPATCSAIFKELTWSLHGRYPGLEFIRAIAVLWTGRLPTDISRTTHKLLEPTRLCR